MLHYVHAPVFLRLLFSSAMVSLSFLTCVASTVVSLASAQSNFYNYDKQFPQQALDGFNALRFMGGLGPYMDRDSVGISRDPPDGCEVDQVFMLHRHGERYPAPADMASFNELIDRLQSFNGGKYQGTLGFLTHWDNFLSEQSYANIETWQGPYAGLSDAFSRGAKYRARYGHLWDEQSPVPIFSSGYERILQTARKFGEGFFGYNYSTIAQMQIIPETPDQGANSLTPTCFADYTEPNPSLDSFPQFAGAAARLNAEYPGLNLTSNDVYSLMKITGYELNNRAMSPWVDVFTLEEWIANRYMNDLFYYYYTGPGNPGSKAIGSVWAKAVTDLMNKSPSESDGSFSNSTNGASYGNMYWSFCHDTNVIPVAVALGLANLKKDLPLDTISFENKFVSTQIVPMGGHITLEKLKCSSSATQSSNSSSPSDSYYVRALINEAVVPWENCSSGPGFSCNLGNFTEMMNQLPDYNKKCQNPKDFPQKTTFFTNYNHSTALNYQQGYVTYQEGGISWDSKAINDLY